MKLEKDLWELEYTHVFEGMYEGEIHPNPDEVSEIKWMKPEKIYEEILTHPHHYARWFRLYVLKYFEEIFSVYPTKELSK